MKKYILYIFLLSTVIACKEVSPLCEDTAFAYSDDIKTIIDANCNVMGCHSQGSENGDFTTYAGLEPTFDKEFKNRVFTRKDMPKGAILNFTDLATLQCWMENGFEE